MFIKQTYSVLRHDVPQPEEVPEPPAIAAAAAAAGTPEGKRKGKKKQRKWHLSTSSSLALRSFATLYGIASG